MDPQDNQSTFSEGRRLASSELLSVQIRLIRDQRFGRRDTLDPDALDSLVRSLRELGQLTPIVVTEVGGAYRLVAGRRRVEAAKRLGWSEIGAMVLSGDDRREASAALAENLARSDLTPLQEARVLRGALDETGCTVGELAASVGRSDVWVHNRLQILEWPEEFQAVADSGALAIAALRQLLEVSDPDYRHTLLMASIENGVTVAQVGRWVNDWKLNQVARRDDELGELAHAPSAQQAEVNMACLMCTSMVPFLQGRWYFLCNDCLRELERAKAEAG